MRTISTINNLRSIQFSIAAHFLPGLLLTVVNLEFLVKKRQTEMEGVPGYCWFFYPNITWTHLSTLNPPITYFQCESSGST